MIQLFAKDLKHLNYQIGQRVSIRIPRAKDVTPTRPSKHTDKDMINTLGTIIGIYTHHILLQLDNYKTCVQKTQIALGLTKFEEVDK